MTFTSGNRTGAGLVQSGLSRRHILWSIDESLKRLDTDWVDLYLAHKEDPYTRLEETLAALDEVVRSGKARYIGFSNWPAWKVAAAMELQKANGWAPAVYPNWFGKLVLVLTKYEAYARHAATFFLQKTEERKAQTAVLREKYVREQEKGGWHVELSPGKLKPEEEAIMSFLLME